MYACECILGIIGLHGHGSETIPHTSFHWIEYKRMHCRALGGIVSACRSRWNVSPNSRGKWNFIGFAGRWLSEAIKFHDLWRWRHPAYCLRIGASQKFQLCVTGKSIPMKHEHTGLATKGVELMGKIGTGFVTQFSILNWGMPKFSSEVDDSEARSISFSRAGRNGSPVHCLGQSVATCNLQCCNPQAMLDMPGSPKSETRCQLILLLTGWYENRPMYAYVGVEKILIFVGEGSSIHGQSVSETRFGWWVIQVLFDLPKPQQVVGVRGVFTVLQCMWRWVLKSLRSVAINTSPWRPHVEATSCVSFSRLDLWNAWWIIGEGPSCDTKLPRMSFHHE